MEREALQKTPRLQLFKQIFLQEPNIVNLNKKSGCGTSLHQRKVKKKKNIKDIAVSGEWMK